MIYRKQRISRGFTTIEIVIVLVIAAIIFTIAVSVFSRFNKNQALGGSADDVASVLVQARSQTLSGKDYYAYGVHFENDRVVLFRGESYDPSTTTNKEVRLSVLSTIVDISLAGGGSDVLFQKQTGATNESGTIVVALSDDTSASTTITISPTGVVERD